MRRGAPTWELLQRYAGKGILLDSNLLLLLVVGTYDRAQVGRYKRLTEFAPEDYDALLEILGYFRNLFITPNTATEVSNLAGALSGAARTACFRVFADTVRASQEMVVPSAHAVSHFAFTELGLTDAAIFHIAGNPPLVLTTDFELSQRLTAQGLPAINFNHIRNEFW